MKRQSLRGFRGHRDERNAGLTGLDASAHHSGAGGEEHAFPSSFDLTDPDIRFDDLARGMGVPAVRVERLEQVGPAIKEALSTHGPFLIDLVVSSQMAGANVATSTAIKGPVR